MQPFRTFQKRLADSQDPEYEKREARRREAIDAENIRREIERFREEYLERWAEVGRLQSMGLAHDNQYFAIPADLVYTNEAKEMLIKTFPLYVADMSSDSFDRITATWMWPISLTFVYGYKFRPTTGIEPKIVPGFSWQRPRQTRRADAVEIPR